MGVYKLAGLYLAQQLLRISAHIAGCYLIANDLSLGIDNESAALSKTIRFDQYLKILGNAVGGVSKHGVVDLFDPLGRIVPCLVDEMGIGGHRIDLTADGPELLVLIRQILQLRGTHKGKVRRIEEKDAPLAKDILLAYKLDRKSVV